MISMQKLKTWCCQANNLKPQNETKNGLEGGLERMFLMNVSTHFWKNKNPGKEV